MFIQYPGMSKSVRFKEEPYAVSALECLEDHQSTSQVKRKVLISLPSTLGYFSLAKTKLDESKDSNSSKRDKAIKIYDQLCRYSILLSNDERMSFLNTGSPERLLCTCHSLDQFGLLTLNASSIDDPQQTPIDDCECYRCGALRRNKDDLRQIGIMFAKGFLAPKISSEAVKFWLLSAKLGSAEAYVDLAEAFESGTGVEKDEEKAFEYYSKAAALGAPSALYELGLSFLESEAVLDDKKGFEYVKKAAEKGHGLAQLELGELYSNGIVVPENPKKAFHWYIKAAASDVEQALWIVGQALESGYGCETDMKEALCYYERAACLGHAEAQRTLGYFMEVDQELDKAFQWYMLASSQEDAIAQYNLSSMFWRGRGTTKNLNQAVFWCTEAAEQGDIAAKVRLAEILHERGEDGDAVKAVYWLDMAASEGHVKAQYLLGNLLMDGHSKDTEEALAWYNEAASRGYPDAQFVLATMYHGGEHLEHNEDLAFSWCERAAEQKHPSAMTMYARMLDTGKGCTADNAKALEYFMKAVDAGDPSAMFYLAYKFQYGQGVTKDLSMAVEMYHKAGELGEKRAQANLGSMYKKGAFVEKDYQKSAYWYRKSAEQGHARAQANLGLLYENGLGVPKDFEEAAFWYHKAASQENEKAMLRFALLCQQGLGVRKNALEAVFWFEAAARLGNPLAVFHLARAHEDGVLVDQDYERAFMLYEQAAASGIVQAKLRLAHLLEHGLGRHGDKVRSMSFYLDAAEQGLVEAQVALAVRMQQIGDPGAILWFQKAADQGHVSAQFVLAKMYLSEGRIEEGLQWYLESANQDNTEALMYLGQLYDKGREDWKIEKDTLKALEFYQKACRLNHVPAMLRAASLLQTLGRASEAVELLLSAARRGDAEAQLQLALALDKGIGVSENAVEANYWYRVASELQESQLRLGANYLKGRGALQSTQQARFWLKQAATNGFFDREAMHLLVDSYLNTGSSEDLVDAFCWLRLLHECGETEAGIMLKEIVDESAFVMMEFSGLKSKANSERISTTLQVLQQCNRTVDRQIVSTVIQFIGDSFLVVSPERESDFGRSKVKEGTLEFALENAKRCFYGTEGTAQDHQQAVFWFEEAADRFGSKDAYFHLSKLYSLGLGVREDKVKSLEYLNRAADSGHAKACILLSEGEEDLLTAYCYLRQASDLGDLEGMEKAAELQRKQTWLSQDFLVMAREAREERTLTIAHVLKGNVSNECIQKVLSMIGRRYLAVRQGQDGLLDVLGEDPLTISHLQQKAFNGDSESAFALGKVYFEGNDEVLQSYDQSGYWFALAARQGHLEAQMSLANQYDRGLGFKSDIDTAIEWYEKAALQGSIEAMRYLSSLYRSGRTNAPQDKLKSYCWMHLGAEFGDNKAVLEMEQIDRTEEWIRQEYRELRQEALVNRKLSFLKGLYPSTSSKLCHVLRKGLLKTMGKFTERDVVKTIFDFASDTFLIVETGLDLCDFLRASESSDEDEEKEKSLPSKSKGRKSKCRIH